MISNILDIKPLLILYLIEYLFATIIFLSLRRNTLSLDFDALYASRRTLAQVLFCRLRGSSIGVIIYKISVLT